MKLQFSRQIFEKKLKYQVSSKSVFLEPSYSMRKDGRDYANAPKDGHETRRGLVVGSGERGAVTVFDTRRWTSDQLSCWFMDVLYTAAGCTYAILI